MKNMPLARNPLFYVVVLFFMYSTCISYGDTACSGQSALIVVSNHFGPYITASNALSKRLKQGCPGVTVSKIFLDRNKNLVSKLNTVSPSVVFPVGTEAALLVHENSPLLPSVFSMVLDPSPVLSKGPDEFGVVLDIAYEHVWEYLRMLAPRVYRIGILYTDESKTLVEKIARGLDETDFRLIKIKVTSPEHIQERFEEIFRLSDALIAIPDKDIYNNIVAPGIIFEAIRHSRPFVGLSKNFTVSGALFSLDCDYNDIGRQAADIGIEIISGERPEIKIQYPRKFTVYLNLHTARSIGLTPSREVLKAFKILVY